ncbi:MAG: IS4 family transposase [Burkholderiaceae bacterium]
MRHGCFFRRFLELRSRQAQAPELPFAEVLTAVSIQSILRELNVTFRAGVYTPLVTLWVFLSQVLDRDPSCRQAVSRLLAYRLRQGQPPCSTDSGSYCEARKRLPEALISRLMQATGRDLAQHAPRPWRFHGRRVKVVDGTTVSMPDTAENAATFDKPRNQHGASGFPVARLVVFMCLATGAALEAAIGPCRGKKTGELSLFRTLHDRLESGDILLGDRLFCNYADLARLQARGIAGVFRLPATRRVDFQLGRRLGKTDHVVKWQRPCERSLNCSPEEYAALPAELEVREVRIVVKTPGFRTRAVIVVTTLLSAEEYPAAELGELFRQRWYIELDLRSIKCVLQMDVLRCLTPEMVRKEIWTHLLAYNLIRSLLYSAAVESKRPLRSFSFKAALQLLNAVHQDLLAADEQQAIKLGAALLHALCEHRVGDRLHRCEPRKRKRLPKPYPRLKLSRDVERNLCRAGTYN